MSDGFFPPNHETRLLTSLKHVDDVVSQALLRIGSGQAESPFSEYVADGNALHQQAAAEFLDRLRALMGGFLNSHQIAIPKGSSSALWGASTACLYAAVSVEDLRGRSMRAYGALSPAASDELDRLANDLTELLRKMHKYFAEASSGSSTNPTPASPG
jgi:hypothetical protein